MNNQVSLEDTKKYIYSINFSNIINKMVFHDNWVRRDAVKTCGIYKNYLYLMRKYGDKHLLVPTEDIDDFLHFHILDTKNYEKDCYAIFGKFMHHYPYFGIDEYTNMNDLNKAFENTQELYFQEFNTYLISTRSKYPRFINYIRKKLDFVLDSQN